jgi:hypothetical protein
MLLMRSTSGLQSKANAFALEHGLQNRRSLWIGNLWSTRALEDRYVGPKTDERLRELAAGWTTADDQQVPRQPALLPNGLGCPVRSVLDTRDRRHYGAGAGAQQYVARPNPPVVTDGQRVRVVETSRAEIYIHSGSLERGRSFESIDALDCGSNRGHDSTQIDRGLNWVDAKSMRRPHTPDDVGCLEQRLARHATGPSAVAADARSLDKCDARSKLRRERRRPNAS